MTDLTVAKTILEQLGGRRFLAMTGARNCIGDSNSLTFRIPECKDDINCVKITLNGLDFYDLEFMRIYGSKVTTVATCDNIDCEQLRGAFEEHTNLVTRL